MERWHGRVALVTGVSTGIGAELCRVLVHHGMTVVGCARTLEKITAITEENAVKISPGKLLPIKCDLSKESDILSMFDEIRQKVGRLDVCINNAGLTFHAPLLTGKIEHFRNMFEVNVMALCICNQQAIKLMQEKAIDDGQIINISSIVGHRVPQSAYWMGLNFYCGTKFMVRSITEGLRREIKAQNSHIRVASISPGASETSFFETYFEDKNSKLELFKMELLQPKDVADSVVYVLSTPPRVEVHDIVLCPYNIC